MKTINFKALVGNKFGKLILKEELEERDKWGKKLGLFSCECGKEWIKPLARVVRGGIKSGCYSCKKHSIDYSCFLGKKFGMIVLQKILEERNKQGQVMGEFTCECGKVVIKNINQAIHLKKTVGCKHCKKHLGRSLYSYVEETFGELTLKKIIPGRRNSKKWGEYECSCSNKEILPIFHVLNGKYKRCRVCENKIKDEKQYINKTFGGLTILEIQNRGKNKHRIAKCRCEICLKETWRFLSQLVFRKPASCGCLKSSMEHEVEIFLSEIGVNFKSQYKDFRCKRVLCLPFDFAVFDNRDQLLFLVEIQGEHHYKMICYSKDKNKNEKTFRLRKEGDAIKRSFCKKQGIPLLEIPYYEFKGFRETIKSHIDKYGGSSLHT